MSAHEQAGPINRLAGESSPYLLLHKHNPVDWYPWGEEALERARREEKPIFLSVGYSTCYWCHVMERESFSNPVVAEQMNRDFVNIKLDREERPEIDEIYMAATQILTGQGGWPNSLFLTPELKPFYAGTYFPPESRYGRPGFSTILEDLAAAWRNRRTDVEEQSAEMARAMQRFLEDRSRPAPEPPDAAVASQAVDTLARRFDRAYGGFGGAPKFPSPSNLYLLQEMAGERPEAAEMLTATLEAMIRGGIYDQVGGAFHRYATDREWKIPHFEKMLYDNGFLMELCAREHVRTGSPHPARAARHTANWLRYEMTSPEGAFLSAMDAETHGHEGAFYVWTREELMAALGEEDFAFFAPIFGFDGPPFFEGTHYVLHLPEPFEAAAERRKMTLVKLFEDMSPGLDSLAREREKREHPLKDDKILADWNGMAITGLAVAGKLLGEELYLDWAARAAEFVLKTMRPAGGPLLHAWREGHGKIPAFLSDYVFMVRGLLALYEGTGEEKWLAAALDLTREQIERLSDPAGGFFVAAASPDVLFRSKEIFDGAIPAANAVAVLNFLDLTERTGDRLWRWEARHILCAFAHAVTGHPDAVRMLALAARRYHETGGDSEEGRAGSGAARAPHEREATAAGVGKLEHEAERLVTARLEMGEEAGGWRPFRLALEIAPGWHLQAHPASEPYLVPTEVRGEVRNVRYPEGETVMAAFAEGELAVYSGTVEISGEVAGGREETEGTAGVVLAYQVCDDSRCLPPVERALTP